MSCPDRLTDVTAIWNPNAFFAYIITVWLNWELRKLLAVVYGDAAQQADAPPTDESIIMVVATSETSRPNAPLVGDLLTLCAAIGFGLYQVMYKRHAALPYDPEFDTGGGVYVRTAPRFFGRQPC